jgi:hypothetical protein
MSSEGEDFEDPAEATLSPKSSQTQQLKNKEQLNYEQSKEAIYLSKGDVSAIAALEIAPVDTYQKKEEGPIVASGSNQA